MKFVKQSDLEQLSDQHDRFKHASPFPNIVLDGFFVPSALASLVSKFPSVNDKRWWVYDNPLEKKFAFNDMSQLDDSFRAFFDEVNSDEFVRALMKLTGIPSLISDPSLKGGGLHQILPCGKLDVHEDFNVHEELSALRRLNMIVYLNMGWQPIWGGELQLWKSDMSMCEARILPVFNRVVLFRTDMGSNHGHPEPLACPHGASRKSLAVYYYEPIACDALIEKRSTTYKKLPGQQSTPELDELRAKRAVGRLQDKTT